MKNTGKIFISFLWVESIQFSFAIYVFFLINHSLAIDNSPFIPLKGPFMSAYSLGNYKLKEILSQIKKEHYVERRGKVITFENICLNLSDTIQESSHNAFTTLVLH